MPLPKAELLFCVSLINDVSCFMILVNLRYRLPIIIIFAPFFALKVAAKNFHQHMLLTQEIRSQFPLCGQITGNSTANLMYLQAVIYKT